MSLLYVEDMAFATKLMSSTIVPKEVIHARFLGEL